MQHFISHSMPAKRKASGGVVEAVKRVKRAAMRPKALSTTSARGSMPTTDFEALTQRVTDEVVSRMDRKFDELMTRFHTMPAHDATAPSSPMSPVNVPDAGVQETVQSQISGFTDILQGTGTCTDNGGANTDVRHTGNPEVLVTKPIVFKQNLRKSQSDFTSCSLETGSDIPDKIKNQIWSGQYVDFHLLLDNENLKFKFQFEMDGDNPEFHLVQHKKSKPLTMSQWLTAWNKFTAIMCMKTPELGQFLPHHLDLILEMSREKGDWNFYDIQFRKLVEKGEANWGTTHLELYLKAKLKSVNVQNMPQRYGSNPRWPQGVCFSYHRGMGCRFGAQCKYQHKCFNCGFSHPFSTCKVPVNLPFKYPPSGLKTNVNRQEQPFRAGIRGTAKPTSNQSEIVPTPTSCNPKMQTKN